MITMPGPPNILSPYTIYIQQEVKNTDEDELLKELYQMLTSLTTKLALCEHRGNAFDSEIDEVNKKNLSLFREGERIKRSLKDESKKKEIDRYLELADKRIEEAANKLGLKHSKVSVQ